MNTIAAVWHGRQDVRIEQVPMRSKPPPNHARLRVHWCGICGTDLQEYENGPVMIRARPHPLTGITSPVVLGHEVSGEVVDIGDGTPGFSIGDRVVADACWRCGRCEWCRGGHYNICPEGGSLGLHSHGGLAELVDVPSYMLYKIPDDLPSDLAALAEPIAVGIHAVRRAGVRVGDSAAVIGAGPVGLATLIAVEAAGCSPLFVVEPNPARRKIALELGAVEAVHPSEAKSVIDATARRGVDAVVECSGSSDAVNLAIRLTKRGGRLLLAGIHKEPTEIDLRRVVLFERELVGTLGYVDDVPRAARLIHRNQDRFSRLITRRIGLADVVEQGLASLQNPATTDVKIVVHP